MPERNLPLTVDDWLRNSDVLLSDRSTARLLASCRGGQRLLPCSAYMHASRLFRLQRTLHSPPRLLCAIPLVGWLN